MDESIETSSQINILLLGESGVGKSTFINAFGNYLNFDSFESAGKENLWWVPSIFTIPDENYEDRVIHIGYNEDDFNENLIGASNTKEPQEYVFNTQNEIRIRLIDTPGFGDSRGIKYDEENILNIMQYVKQYSHLNAICFLLKPNISILSEYFKCCITLLFSFLDAEAAANVIFVFTNSRSTFYKPGETRTVLIKLLEEMSHSPPYVKVPLVKANMFCMDNESFRYKVAMQKGFPFSEKEIANFEESWKISRESCKQLLNYVLGCFGEEALKPFILWRQLEHNPGSNRKSGDKEVSNDYNLFRDAEISSIYNQEESMVDKTFDFISYDKTEINLNKKQLEFINSNIHSKVSCEELPTNENISDHTNYNISLSVDSDSYSVNTFNDIVNYEEINRTKRPNLNYNRKLYHRNNMQNHQSNANVPNSSSDDDYFEKKKKKCNFSYISIGIGITLTILLFYLYLYLNHNFIFLH